MKAGIFLLGLLWLAVSTYAGYRLTEKSFSWVDQPNFGLERSAAAGSSPLNFDLGAIQAKLPKAGQDPAAWFKSLSPQAQACLQASIGKDRVEAALRGEVFQPTPSEALAIAKCLK